MQNSLDNFFLRVLWFNIFVLLTIWMLWNQWFTYFALVLFLVEKEKKNVNGFLLVQLVLFYILGQITTYHLWFGQNLSCLSVIWNLTIYPPEVISIRVSYLTSVKNWIKYVFLLHFYFSLLQKHKK